jgi:hypothetical protein
MVSFWANSSAAQRIGVNLFQSPGTGGSPSPGVWALATGLSVTTLAGTTFSRFTVGPIAIPSLSGKTMGTAGNDYTDLWFFYSAGANYAAQSGNVGVQSGVINIWGIQLEIGNTVTPLEKLDPQQDLAKCQRFYQVGQFLMQGNTTSGTVGGTYCLPVQMRAAATIILTSNGNNNVSGTTATQLLSTGAVLINAALVAGGPWTINQSFTASADL